MPRVRLGSPELRNLLALRPVLAYGVPRCLHLRVSHRPATNPRPDGHGAALGPPTQALGIKEASHAAVALEVGCKGDLRLVRRAAVAELAAK